VTRFKKSLKSVNTPQIEEITGFIYRIGTKNVVITAPHAQGPSSDLFTGEIAYKVGERTGAHVLISTVSRDKLDLNYPSDQARMSPFRSELKNLVQHLVDEYEEVLVVDLHGMDKKDGPDIYLGTLAGTTARIRVINFIIEEFETEGLEVWLAEYFEPSLIGGDIISSIGNLGETIDAVQIEINQQNRQLGNKKLLHALVQVITQWIKKYGPVWGTAAILRRITGVKFPIETKPDLTRLLGGKDSNIHWAKEKRWKVKEIVDSIEDECLPIKSSKRLIQIIKNIRR